MVSIPVCLRHYWGSCNGFPQDPVHVSGTFDQSESRRHTANDLSESDVTTIFQEKKKKKKKKNTFCLTGNFL